MAKRTRPLSIADIDEIDDEIAAIEVIDPGDSTRIAPASDASTGVAVPADASTGVAVPSDEGIVEIAHDVHVVDPAGEAARLQQLSEGIRTLRVGGGSLNLSERTLMVAGGVLAPLGVAIILLGYFGASGTGYVFEQIPYLISGGLVGLALVFLGAFFYFAHWMTELVKEHRAQSTAIIDALMRLQTEVANQGGADRAAFASPNGASGPGGQSGDDVVLVATTNGSMAHRPECPVVTGKSDLRRVARSDGLAACKMCGPYDEDDALS